MTALQANDKAAQRRALSALMRASAATVGGPDAALGTLCADLAVAIRAGNRAPATEDECPHLAEARRLEDTLAEMQAETMAGLAVLARLVEFEAGEEPEGVNYAHLVHLLPVLSGSVIRVAGR